MQVKNTLYTFWVLKVTLRDRTNSNSMHDGRRLNSDGGNKGAMLWGGPPAPSSIHAHAHAHAHSFARSSVGGNAHAHRLSLQRKSEVEVMALNASSSAAAHAATSSHVVVRNGIGKVTGGKKAKKAGSKAKGEPRRKSTILRSVQPKLEKQKSTGGKAPSRMLTSFRV